MPFLGEEGEQVHRLGFARRIRGVEAGGGEQLLDEIVELRDVPLDARPPLRIATQQLDCHPDAGKGSAKLMRRPGEDVALRFDQALDPVRGAIEALRQTSDLILSFHLDPGGERSRPKLVHPHLQPFDPAGEPAGERPRPGRDGDREQGQGPQPQGQPMRERAREPMAPCRRRLPPSGEPAPVVETNNDGTGVCPRMMQGRCPLPAPSWTRGNGRTGRGHEPPRCVVEGDVHAEASRKDFECTADRTGVLPRRRQRSGQQIPDPGTKRRPLGELLVEHRTPDPGGHPREHREREEHHEKPEIDAQVEPPHGPLPEAPPAGE